MRPSSGSSGAEALQVTPWILQGHTPHVHLQSMLSIACLLVACLVSAPCLICSRWFTVLHLGRVLPLVARIWKLHLKNWRAPYIHWLFFCCQEKSLMITLFCVCRQREQCSGEPRLSSLMCQRIQTPSTRFVHSWKWLRLRALALQQHWSCLSECRFSSEESWASCPALLTAGVCVYCLYKQWSIYL